MIYKTYAQTPFGYLMVEETDGAITSTDIYTQEAPPPEAYENTPPPTELLSRAVAELSEYFQGQRRDFDLPLAPRGTPFQKKVWRALTHIPYGSTATYKDIAIAVDCPKGFRAVGMANNRNPIPFLIPCHRVIGSDGSLVGFGMGLALKQQLLDLERQVTLNVKRQLIKEAASWD